MRSVSGIRGIVGDSLTPTTLLSHVKAFLEITKAKKIVIGRDSRPTGDAISNFVTAFCRLSGTEVIDAGLSTTPTVEILVTETKADGGIIITASHNPVEWNALKFLDNKGLFLGPKAVESLFKIADQGDFIFPDYTQVATSSILKDADDIHINGTLGIEFVDTQAIKNKRFKVAIDAVNRISDILVVSPNLDVYRTAIFQCFDQQSFQIPFSIVDSPAKKSLTGEALSALFAMQEKRTLSRSIFFDLVRNPVI